MLTCCVLLAYHVSRCCASCRENIEKDIELERRREENPDLMEDDVDAVPCITRYCIPPPMLVSFPHIASKPATEWLLDHT